MATLASIRARAFLKNAKSNEPRYKAFLRDMVNINSYTENIAGASCLVACCGSKAVVSREFCPPGVRAVADLISEYFRPMGFIEVPCFYF